ncbi:MAG: signal peptidase II [Clostridia bacterium]|nr:signal peptidase II [Clostridia bacterium]
MMIYAVILFAVIAIDQITKIYVSAQGPLWEVVVIPNVFSFIYGKNSGAAFSSFAGTGWAQTFFAVLTFIILPVLFVVFLRVKNENKWLKTTIILIIAGTIGNFIDRLVFKEVTDFIYVHFFANFNVADISLTVGAIMLVFYFVFLDKEALIPIGKNRKKKANG